MEIIYTWVFPEWVIALVMIIESVLMVYVHRRMTWPIRLSMSIPVLGLALIFLVFWVFPIPLDAKRFFGRNFLGWLFLWRAVLLWVTRKEHRV